MSKGQRIKELREHLHLGLTELAEKINVSKQTLYKYENDIVTNIPSDKIEELASALNTTPAYLMGWEDSSGNSHADMIIPEQAKTDEQYAEFLTAYTQASPDVQKAVRLILRVDRHDS